MSKFYSSVFVVAVGIALMTVSALTAEQPVTGTFKGNGKDAKLAYAVAHPGEPFSGEETVVVVLTEKDTAADPRPEIMASFGDFGSALILTFQRSGNLVGCEVAHTAHDKSPFSSIGKASDFKIDGDKVEAAIDEILSALGLKALPHCRQKVLRKSSSPSTIGGMLVNTIGPPSNIKWSIPSGVCGGQPQPNSIVTYPDFTVLNLSIISPARQARPLWPTVHQ